MVKDNVLVTGLLVEYLGFDRFFQTAAICETLLIVL